MTEPMLQVRDLVVEYHHEGYAVRPLDGLGFDARAGEMVVLLGPSGSGKTTLLSCLGGILSPTSGSIVFDGTELVGLAGGQLDEHRRNRVGFVFQAFNLIPSLTARENIAVPLMLNGRSRAEAFQRADQLLDEVGLAERANHKPGRLSGGQQQRVAVARGLGQDPPLLLADEPTANLDYIQAETVIRLLRELKAQGRVIVVSTHDARLVPIADQVVQMAQGGVQAEAPVHEITVAAGTSIFEQGDASDVVYVIGSGEVDIVRVLDDGEERLRVLHAGQYFGELGALMGFPRSASARALTDVTLTVYPPRIFRDEVLGAPH